MSVAPESVSIIVPVYNGSASLRDLVRRVHGTFAPRECDFELILVDDGSADDSRAVIRELEAEHPWVVGIELMRNYGQHNALLCGMREAQYDVIVTIDDDLQNPPEEIPALLDALVPDIDLVYGAPVTRRQSIGRRLGAILIRRALRAIMPRATADQASSFRAFRSSLRDASLSYRSDSVSIDVLLSWATTRVTSVTVRHDARHSGSSTYDFPRLVRHAIDMLTGFSTLPLRLASLLGLLFTMLGTALLAYVVIRYLIQGTNVPGFAFIASSIAMFSGVQLFCLGIIGEYVARIHLRAMDRPVYAVRRRGTRSEMDQ